MYTFVSRLPHSSLVLYTYNYNIYVYMCIRVHRYSGLRRDDFNDVIDSLTSLFSSEIGPARDRESSLRQEGYVYAGGGCIRGLKTTKDGKQWVST